MGAKGLTVPVVSSSVYAATLIKVLILAKETDTEATKSSTSWAAPPEVKIWWLVVMQTIKFRRHKERPDWGYIMDVLLLNSGCSLSICHFSSFKLNGSRKNHVVVFSNKCRFISSYPGLKRQCPVAERHDLTLVVHLPEVTSEPPEHFSAPKLQRCHHIWSAKVHFVHFGETLRSPLQIYGFAVLQNRTRQLAKPFQTCIRNLQLEYHRRTFDNLFAFVFSV